MAGMLILQGTRARIGAGDQPGGTVYQGSRTVEDPRTASCTGRTTKRGRNDRCHLVSHRRGTAAHPVVVRLVAGRVSEGQAIRAVDIRYGERRFSLGRILPEINRDGKDRRSEERRVG